MGPRVTHNRILGALVLCVALFGCIRQDSLYPMLTSMPPVNMGTVRVVTADAETPPSVPAVVEIPAVSQPEPQTVVVPPQVPTDPPPEPEPEQSPAEQPSEPEVKQVPPPVEKPKPRVSHIRSYWANREVRSTNIKMFPRWTGMVGRYAVENHTLDSVCGSERDQPCKLKEWKAFLEGLREAPLYEKVKEINRYLNKYPYIDDIVNWGFDNYWETPYEFQRKSGNCKDYAIAKFMSLRAIGVPNDLMRITVLRDLNLGGAIHAVLVVSVDEKNYILDNQIKQVVPTDKVYHYVPIYSINEEYWWQHFME
jgi:predicted transglutaminase-like cysteine proteinase